MNPERITILCAPLMLLKFFPTEPQARASVILLIADMATNEDQVRWLIGRMLDLYDEWPGPRTLRAVFCHKYRPADGKDLRTAICAGYPEGLPSEKPERPVVLELPPGHNYTADPQLEAAVAQAFDEMPKMPEPQPLTGHVARFARELEEAITAPQDRPLPPAPTNPNYRPVTQDDIDRAVEEYRRRKGEVTE